MPGFLDIFAPDVVQRLQQRRALMATGKGWVGNAPNDYVRGLLQSADPGDVQAGLGLLTEQPVQLAKMAAYRELMGGAPTTPASPVSSNSADEAGLLSAGSVPYYLSNESNDQKVVNGLLNQSQSSQPPQPSQVPSVPGVPYFNPQQMYRTGMLYNMAGIPGGGELIRTALAHDPSLAAATTAATKSAAMPYDAVAAVLHGAGRNVVVSPGQKASSGIALMPQQFQNYLFGAMGGQGGASGPARNIPSIEGMPPIQAESQKEYAANLEKQYSGWQQNADKGQNDNLIINQMERESGGFKPGYFASNLGKWKSFINGLDPSGKMFDQSLGDFQAFNKNALALSTGAARQMGAREPGSVIQMFQKAYPSADLVKTTLQGMFTQFRGINDYNILQQQSAQQWRNDHAGTLDGFQSKWNEVMDPQFTLFQRMPPEVQQRFVATMGKEKATGFFKKMKLAEQNRFLPQPGWQK